MTDLLTLVIVVFSLLLVGVIALLVRQGQAMAELDKALAHWPKPAPPLPCSFKTMDISGIEQRLLALETAVTARALETLDTPETPAFASARVPVPTSDDLTLIRRHLLSLSEKRARRRQQRVS